MTFSRAVEREITQGCQLSGNMVHSDNKLSIRWLEWLGYSFLQRLSVGEHTFWEFAKLHV